MNLGPNPKEYVDDSYEPKQISLFGEKFSVITPVVDDIKIGVFHCSHSTSRITKE